MTPGIYTISSYKTFGSQKINDDAFLALVGSISSIFNGSFRYVWGQVMDKLNFQITCLIIITIQTILISTLYYIAAVKALYLIWISLIVCCEGGFFSVYPTIMARIYGKK